MNSEQLGSTYSGYDDHLRTGYLLLRAETIYEQDGARFRSFTRIGSSNLDGTDKTDTFEVELEDWLLENLTESFVVPEDLNMYRKLVRPTAKGISQLNRRLMVLLQVRLLTGMR